MRLCSNEGLQEEKTPPEGLETSYLCHMTDSLCKRFISMAINPTRMKGNTNAAVFSPDAFIDASYEDDTLKLTRRNGTSKSIEIAGGEQFTLKVTYSGAPDLPGITVTATPQTGTAGNPVVGTTGFDGVAYLTVKQNGTYKITSSKAGYTFASTPTVTCTSQTTEASVSCYVPGTVTVTVSDEKGSAAGRTVTATASGQTTQTKTVVTGQTSVTFSLPAGSWTFKTDYPSGATGGESKTLTVENNKSYSVTLKVAYYIVYGFSIAVGTTDPDARVTYPQTVFGQTNAAYGKTPASGTGANCMNGWAGCELISGIKRQTGSGSAWTDVSDKKKAVAGSASSMVMTYVPTWYMKMTNDGTNIVCAFSMEQIDSTWKDYAGSMGSNHVGHFRVGCYACKSDFKSYAGSPRVNTSITSFIAGCQELGSGYDIMTWYQWTYLVALAVLLYKSTDLQNAMASGCVSSDEVNAEPAVAFENDYGMYGILGTSSTRQMAFFWIKNLWGNMHQFVGGAKTNSSYKLMTGTGYSSTDEADFDKKNLGGPSSKTYGAVKTVGGTTDAGFFPTNCSGSYTTYFADYGNVSSSHFPYVGGCYDSYGEAGPFGARFFYSASESSSSIGSRLSYRL